MNSNPAVADLRAYVANCLVAGQFMTNYNGFLLRDTLKFECEGRVFTLKQSRSVVERKFNEMKGKFCETTEIIVSNVGRNEVQKCLAAIDRICWLLSFAGLSKVMRYEYEYPDGSSLGMQDAVSGTVEFFRPTLDLRDGRLIAEFIQQTYPTYVIHERRRRLNVVIDYLLQAERSNQPTECKLIFAFVLLENLKESFARSKSIPYVKGFFRVSDAPKARAYGFEELLQLMLKDVGMRRGLKRIVKIRNEILHSGLYLKPHSKRWAAYERIHDLLREYVLRLLGYRGNYLTYVSASNSSKKL
ncbi:hypothetical protein [Massilia sp. erpn]|uniref:hypothetical protein n=1 Tax=Massilia sp. erpn TaxID=2738142 RepID=UPI0021066A46|nr:hypothetical protein [Massilia sp. erpn]UTY60468.1 hypothetical protein HPQ68_26710 [Massilia sp. erpn]